MNKQIEKLFEDKILSDAVDKTKEYIRLMSYYKCALMEVETKLNVLNVEYSLQHDRNPINSIKSRVKSPIAIREKLERRGCEYDLQSIEENINDIAGLRVCCSFVEDVYIIAEALLKQDDITLIAKKDYIQNPKDNGYRSLHLIVAIPIYLSSEKKMMKVEIQLRTIAMDFWASIEHELRYKKEYKFTDEMATELLNCAKISADLDERMVNLKQMIEK